MSKNLYIVPIIGFCILLSSCKGSAVSKKANDDDPPAPPCVVGNQISEECSCMGENYSQGFCCDWGWTSYKCSCGNGTLDEGEECDGSNLNGQTCQGLGFDGGALQCGNNCMYRTVACTGSAHRLMMEDFEDQDYLDTMMTTSGGGDSCNTGSGFGSLAIVDHAPRQGRHSLRWDRCNLSVDPLTGLPGCNNVFLMVGGGDMVPQAGTSIDLETPVSRTKELYVQFWTRYDIDNDPSDNYGQEKFAVGGIPGNLSFHRNGFGGAMESYIYGANYPPVFIHDGQWHKIAYYHKYNDPGLTNSILRGWVDDQLVFEHIDLHEFDRLAWLLRMKYFHAGGAHFPHCTSSPTHLDDYEVWDSMPDIQDCENGPIENLCWCGGSSRDYGFCFNNYWNPDEMPTCVPSKEICSDGIDNDCDGFTDCADSDCSQLGMCVDLECDEATIMVASRRRHMAYFNGEYLGYDQNPATVSSDVYYVPLRRGNNAFTALVMEGEPFIARIEYCGNVIVTDSTWKTTPTKPYGWMDPAYDASWFDNAIVVADWGSQGTWYYGLPEDWPSPDAKWIWRDTIGVPDGYTMGWFRKDFNINTR